MTLRFARPEVVTSVRIIGDSQLHRDKRMPCSYPARMPRARMPDPLPRDLRIEALAPDGVSWKTVAQVRDNDRRLLRVAIAVETAAIRLVIERAWGDGRARLFAFEAGEADPLAAHEILPWPATAISGRGVA